jgi:hypothetical protein
MNQQLSTINKTTLYIVVAAILSMAALRVLNTHFHIYHMVPMAALGLVSGSLLTDKRIVYLIPLVSMLLSDIGIALVTPMPGFYGVSQFINYMALASVTFLGTFLLRKNALNIAGYTLGGSMVFFIISNFGVWAGGYYGYTWAGLVECYAMALPFYKSEVANQFFFNSFMGDFLFSFLVFGIAALMNEKQLPAEASL